MKKCTDKDVFLKLTELENSKVRTFEDYKKQYKKYIESRTGKKNSKYSSLSPLCRTLLSKKKRGKFKCQIMTAISNKPLCLEHYIVIDMLVK
jgi:hypothetical protein